MQLSCLGLLFSSRASGSFSSVKVSESVNWGFAVIAYVAGQLVEGVGNQLERLVWLRRGCPRPGSDEPRFLISVILNEASCRRRCRRFSDTTYLHLGNSTCVVPADPLIVSEVGKERIRRAGANIRENLECKVAGELPGSDEHSTLREGLETLDTGFRVLKIDSSNMAEVYYQPDQLKQDALDLQIDNVREGRTPEDLLFQVLLDWGVDLGLPITEESIEGKKVFFVDDNALAACFDIGLTEDFCKTLAKREPLRAVFRYASDATKINIEQIFKALSPHTELKTL